MSNALTGNYPLQPSDYLYLCWPDTTILPVLENKVVKTHSNLWELAHLPCMLEPQTLFPPVPRLWLSHPCADFMAEKLSLKQNSCHDSTINKQILVRTGRRKRYAARRQTISNPVYSPTEKKKSLPKMSDLAEQAYTRSLWRCSAFISTEARPTLSSYGSLRTSEDKTLVRRKILTSSAQQWAKLCREHPESLVRCCWWQA